MPHPAAVRVAAAHDDVGFRVAAHGLDHLGIFVSSCCRSLSRARRVSAELAMDPSMQAEERPLLPRRWRHRTRRSLLARGAHRLGRAVG